MTNGAACVQNREKTRLSSDWNSNPAKTLNDRIRCPERGATSDREETWLPRSDAAGVRVRCCCCRWHSARPLPPITTPPASNWVVVFSSRSGSDARARRPRRHRAHVVHRLPVREATVATTLRLLPIEFSPPALAGCGASLAALCPRDAVRWSRRRAPRRALARRVRSRDGLPHRRFRPRVGRGRSAWRAAPRCPS